MEKRYLFQTIKLILTVFVVVFSTNIFSQSTKNTFKVLVLAERGGLHEPYVEAGLKWLETASRDNNFTFDVVNDTKKFDDDFLSKYQVILQLNFPPYTWSKVAEDAFIKYIEQGKGGWVGFHHATLLGEFDGYPLWKWFSDFMGGIQFKNYIAPLANANVIIEDSSHPIMKGVPTKFLVTNDEWYTYDKNPRPNVKVLAHVDESSYSPKSDIKMGDHPVVWINEKVKARNVYIFMGHHKDLYKNKAYETLVINSILWVAGK